MPEARFERKFPLTGSSGSMKVLAVDLERSGSGRWSLRISDLKALRHTLGENLVDSIFCCFVHAVRVTSLDHLMSLSQSKDPDDSIASKRNWMAFFFFLAGTLKELSLELGRLRGALCKRGIWDEAAWNRALKKWEDWGGQHDSSHLRNMLAFHVVRREVARGLRLIKPQDAKIVLEGDGPKEKDSWSPLATIAPFRALEDEVPDLILTLKKPAELLDVSSALEEEFLRILKTSNIQLTISDSFNSEV